MLKKLKDILFTKDKYYALSISSSKEDNYFYLITISYDNENLNIENRESFQTFEVCLEHLVNDYPILLHFEGNNIINKIVEKKNGYRKELIFNANPDEFYFYEYFQDNQIFSSIARKSNIDPYIELLNKTNNFVFNVSFGPFVMVNLLKIITDADRFSSQNYSLKIENEKLLSFKNEDNHKANYTINGEHFNQNEMPLLASFLGYKYPSASVEFDTSFLETNKTEFKFKKRAKVFGVTALVAILLLLLISHTLQTIYQNSLAKKDSLYLASQQTQLEFENLKKEKSFKESILQNSGINSTNFIAKYMADIGNSIPDEITLKAITFRPVKKKIRENEEINFEANVIYITGEAKTDQSFNLWTVILKSLPWIKKLDVDYNQDNKTINSFIINIKI